MFQRLLCRLGLHGHKIDCLDDDVAAGFYKCMACGRVMFWMFA